MSHPAIAFAERVRTGAPSFAAWCGIPDPLVPELMVREGFDCAVLDMQHGAYDYAIASQAIANVAAAGKPAIVRVPVGEFTTASRMLDAGASGIIAPMVNTVADAKLLASFTKFPPTGERSWGPARALSISGLAPLDYLKQANGFSLTIAMIETRAAMAALDAILAVDGIDGRLRRPLRPVDRAHGRRDGQPAASRGGQGARPHRRAGQGGGEVRIRLLRRRQARAEVAAKGYQVMSVGTDSVLLRAGCEAGLKAAQATGKATQQSAY